MTDAGQVGRISVQLRRLRGAPGRVGDIYAHVAQSVERILGKDEVTGSIPVVGSMTTSA